MRSPAEIIRHIDTSIAYALQRPHMYASTPDALDQVLSSLEFVRHFILVPGAVPHVADNPYSSFLRDHDFGVAQFTTRQDPTQPAEKRFADLAAFWRPYLASSYRLPGPTAEGSG
jgi:hypothetical protein